LGFFFSAKPAVPERFIDNHLGIIDATWQMINFIARPDIAFDYANTDGRCLPAESRIYTQFLTFSYILRFFRYIPFYRNQKFQ